ncbi:hypothetical protein BBJ28_00005996 [Nothophytophthora sp. Chile5]|nr:hypothetical protein BBJ28_00005996 [Nothophytophthora sp. Chile5]
MPPFTQSALALMAVIAAASSSGAASAFNQAPRSLQTYSQSDDYFTPMLERVNQERAAEGLSALCWNSKLQVAAQRLSDDMATNNFVGHTGSDGSDMGERLKDAGYEGGASAENAEGGSPNVTAAMDDWMHSEGHRTNIMGNYTMLGAAYAYNADSSYKHYWTQDFGSGDAEQCDDTSGNGSSSSSSSGEQSEASTSQETPEPSTASPTLTPETETPSTETPAAETPAPETSTPTTDSPTKGGCKAKM